MRTRRAGAIVGTAAWLAASLLADAALAQCAMCKATVEGSVDGIGADFNRAILVMLAGPYLLMGAFGVALFRERIREGTRRLRARLTRSGPGRAR